MIRFSSSIRFITRAEWMQLRLNELPTVLSWDMHMPDQWVPRQKSTSCSMAPCIAGGLTGVQTQPETGDKRGQVGMSHLIPVYHSKPEEQKTLKRYIQHAATSLQAACRLQAPLPALLKGCFVGGYASSTHRLWPTICQGLAQVIQQSQTWFGLKNSLAYTGWVTPAVPKPISAFIEQHAEGLSHMAYDGEKDTWYIIGSVKGKARGEWHVVRSAKAIRQLYTQRQVGSDDQVYIGMKSQTPIPVTAVTGHGLDASERQPADWVVESEVSKTGMADLDDAFSLTSVRSGPKVLVLPQQQREQRERDR